MRGARHGRRIGSDEPLNVPRVLRNFDRVLAYAQTSQREILLIVRGTHREVVSAAEQTVYASLDMPD